MQRQFGIWIPTCAGMTTFLKHHAHAAAFTNPPVGAGAKLFPAC